jgi:hypothetical protein
MDGVGAAELIPEYFSFSRDLDNLFVESGRQAHVIWRLDGSYGGLRAVSKEIVNPPGGGTEGIWAEPLRLADYVHFHLWDADCGLAAVERHAKRYTRTPGSSEIFYQFGTHPHLEARKTVWVPLRARAVVVELVLRNVSDRPRSFRLFTEFQSRLGVGWPLREGGRNTAAYEPSVRGVVAHEEGHPEWTAVCATSREPQSWHLGDFAPHLIGSGTLPAGSAGGAGPGLGRSCLQHGVNAAPGEESRLVVVVSGSAEGEAEALATAQEVMSKLDGLREERRSHYRRIFSETTVLESPSYVMNKAFLWAKLGTEDFKHYDPRLGFLFFAGYPAYNFYFASDSMLILRGSLATGDFDDAREMLRTIVRYQAVSEGRDTKPGEIWHEMSTSGDRISPNFAGFLFPGLLRALYAWTGDRAYLDEMYPRARAVVEWGYSMDRDGDGLLENGPEGEMADSASEDRNVERAQYLVQTQWFDALREGIRLAETVGDAASAGKWCGTLERLRPMVDDLYWNEEARFFEETLRPDGCLDTSGKGFPNLDPEMVDEGKAAVTARLLLEEEAYLEDEEAFRARQRFERTFSTNRSYMSWYVIERGRRALALYRAHRPEPAHRALEEIALSPFHFTTPGMWPEVWAVDEPSSLRVRGCFHQAWTGSHGFIHPVTSGLLGIEPDAPGHALSFDPHLPPHWPRVALRRLRVGGGTVDLECEQAEGRRLLAARNDGTEPLTLRFGFALEPAVELGRLCVNGEVWPIEELEVRTTPTDVHAYVAVTAAPGAWARAELRWRAAALDIEGPEPFLLERASPGTTATLSFTVRNLSYRLVLCTVEVELPAGWAEQRSVRMPLRLPAGEGAPQELAIVVPPDAREGYHTVRLRVVGGPEVLVSRAAYLPVFRPLAASVDCREIARVGMPCVVHAAAVNLSSSSSPAALRVAWPRGWKETRGPVQPADIAPGARLTAAVEAVPHASGDVELSVEVGRPREPPSHALRRRVRVLPPSRPLVLYSGFLGCPIASDRNLEVLSVPASYALRKPHVLAELLPLADLFLTTDQHDGVLAPEQVEALAGFVAGGKAMLFFCAWSAPWGRGFFDTFGGLGGTRFPELLPLHMRKGIGHSREVRLTAAGSKALGGLDWGSIPAFDYNEAELRPGARLLAESAEGSPLVAEWQVGKGRVMAIAVDCFGFESYVEGLSFDFWPEKPRLIRRGVDRLLGAKG